MRTRVTSTFGFVCLALALLAGCENRTLGGVAAGGAIGAGTGAIIGSQSGHAGEGVAIGAGIGMLSGGLIGAALDDMERQRLATESPATLRRVETGRLLSSADIIAMSRSGVSDSVIIQQIYSTRSVYYLNAGDIISLRNQGVSNQVLDVMASTPDRYSDYYAPPVYPEPRYAY